MASTPVDTIIDQRLQKFFAILLVAVICQLQSFSRVNYVRFSNLFALYKIILLSIITILGWCALGNKRTAAAAATSTDNSYGIINLKDSFRGTTTQAYPIALAMLDIMRVYSGYENANFVSHGSPLFDTKLRVGILTRDPRDRSLKKSADHQEMRRRYFDVQQSPPLSLSPFSTSR